MWRTRLSRGGVLLAVVLAGCGGTSAGRQPSVAVSAKTSHGLSYSLRITGTGSEQCATSTYSSPLANGRPIVDTAHSCGVPSPGHPVLIQAHTSAESLVTDVTAGSCGRVRAGSRATRLRPVVTHCTTGEPVYRVTILPQAKRLVIAGIPGAPVVNFPRHICSTGICITPLLVVVVPKPAK
jgi:hypothetical protein